MLFLSIDPTMNIEPSPISTNTLDPYTTFSRYHFETIIYETTIKYVNDYEEAEEFIQKHLHKECILFYQSSSIESRDHNRLRSLSHELGIYEIHISCQPSTFESIANFLYKLHSIINSVCTLSSAVGTMGWASIAKLFPEQIDIMNNIQKILLPWIEQQNIYVDSSIINRTYDLINKLNEFT